MTFVRISCRHQFHSRNSIVFIWLFGCFLRRRCSLDRSNGRKSERANEFMQIVRISHWILFALKTAFMLSLQFQNGGCAAVLWWFDYIQFFFCFTAHAQHTFMFWFSVNMQINTITMQQTYIQRNARFVYSSKCRRGCCFVANKPNGWHFTQKIQRKNGALRSTLYNSHTNYVLDVQTCSVCFVPLELSSRSAKRFFFEKCAKDNGLYS